MNTNDYCDFEITGEEDERNAAAQYADDCARRLAVSECWQRIKHGTFTQCDIDKVDAALRALL